MSFTIEDGVLKKYNYEEQEETVVIPEGVTVIAMHAFVDCRKVKHVSIPNTVQEIGIAAFGNSGIEDIVVPDSVTKLDSSVFRDCSRLKSAVIGNGVTELGDRLFSSCQELVHLELPSGLKKVGSRAFLECYSLQKVWVDGTEYWISGNDVPKPVQLVFDSLEEIRDKIRFDYENGLMDEFEYVDYQIAGDGYSY